MHVVRLDHLAGAVVVHRVLALAVRRRTRATCERSRLKPVRLPCAVSMQSASGSMPTWLHCTRFTLLISARSMSKCAMDFALRRELGRIAGHAVVEARAQRDQEVAIVDRVVGERRAVHAEHAHRERVAWCRRRRCPSAW